MAVGRSERTGVGILGTGSYLPAGIVSNDLVAERAGVTAEWIRHRTGIRSRRYAAAGEAASDLAVEAARAALDAAGLTPDRIGLIVVATSTPDHPQPATACLVQSRLRARHAAAFDLNSVCSGFVFALVTAARLLDPAAPGARRYALVIGTDVYSRIVDPADRRTAVLFGDGAGAVVLGPVRPGHGLIAARLASDGARHDLIHVRAGGSREPASARTVAEGGHWFRMDGRGVSAYVRTELPRRVQELLDLYDVPADAVHHFVPHQANGVLLRSVLPDLGLPRARVHLTVDEHANTGSASIPLTLDTVRRRGAFADGELVLLAGFGGGMSLGTALLRWQGDADNH